jgi:hypothetical protein
MWRKQKGEDFDFKLKLYRPEVWPEKVKLWDVNEVHYICLHNSDLLVWGYFPRTHFECDFYDSRIIVP